MIFIIRRVDGPPAGQTIKVTRQTPAIAATATGQLDYFCTGDLDAARAAGLPVFPVHDGWYADDTGGGVAVWGQGRYWEVRDTPFTVKEASGPSEPREAPADMEPLNVRQAIFGA